MTKQIISPENTFANAVISVELDNRARLWAARLRLTRSKLIGLALGDFVDRLEKEQSKKGVSNAQLQRN